MKTLNSVCVVAIFAVVALVWGCAPAGVPNSVTIGKQTHVCVTINNYTQAYFTPTADSFSRLTFNGCTFAAAMRSQFLAFVTVLSVMRALAALPSCPPLRTRASRRSGLGCACVVCSL